MTALGIQGVGFRAWGFGIGKTYSGLGKDRNIEKWGSCLGTVPKRGEGRVEGEVEHARRVVLQQGLGFRVLGFGVEFRVWGVGFRV